jgi:hypothetical protein
MSVCVGIVCMCRYLHVFLDQYDGNTYNTDTYLHIVIYLQILHVSIW